MINYKSRCEFYIRRECPITKNYIESASKGSVGEDLISQREIVCSQKNPDCTIRRNLLAGLTEAI